MSTLWVRYYYCPVAVEEIDILSIFLRYIIWGWIQTQVVWLHSPQSDSLTMLPLINISHCWINGGFLHVPQWGLPTFLGFPTWCGQGGDLCWGTRAISKFIAIVCYPEYQRKLLSKEPQGKMLGTGPAAATTATTTSSNVSVLQQFASGLKSRNEETRAKAAKELQHYVTMELREVGASVIWGCSLWSVWAKWTITVLDFFWQLSKILF